MHTNELTTDDDVRRQSKLDDFRVQHAKRKSWAELLARVFNIDMKTCHLCGGEFKIISAILESTAIRKILVHLGLPDEPPDIAPARIPSQMSFA